MAKSRRGFGTLRKLPSGRWQASYVGPDAGRHTSPTTYATKTDADFWLLEERRHRELVGPDGWTSPAVRAAAAVKGSGPTLRQYAPEWIRDKLATKEIRRTTAEKYEQALRLRVLDRNGVPALGDVPVAELSPRQVAAWWRKLDHDHERACDLAYQALRAMMQQAVVDELRPDNPCRVKGAGGASSRRPIEPLTPAQVQACADGMPEQWAIAVPLGAWCSLRSGEVRELRRRDIDLSTDRPVVHVRRGVVRVGGKLEASTPKTHAGVRDVGIPAPLVEPLRKHLAEHAQPGANGLLIWSEATGAQVHDASLRRAWNRATKDAGVSGFRFHDLRHTGLTYAGMAGATVRELQHIAGHTTPAMAMRYQEIASQHLASVYDRLGALIDPDHQTAVPTHNPEGEPPA